MAPTSGIDPELRAPQTRVLPLHYVGKMVLPTRFELVLQP